jgi:hypothetical protein
MKSIDHLSNCQRSDEFYVPRFMRYNTMYSVIASVNSYIRNETAVWVSCSSNTFLLLFAFHQAASINDPNISLKTYTSRILPGKFCFLISSCINSTTQFLSTSTNAVRVRQSPQRLPCNQPTTSLPLEATSPTQTG